MTMRDTDRPGQESEPGDREERDPFGNEHDEALDLEPATGDNPGQLELGDEDVALPWLEGDDDFGDEGGSGGSILLLALMALAALALIIGGIWWFTRDHGEAELVADGSIIEAPEQPYKTKPENPGGKTFEGTGDTSFAVSEGETRPVRLGTEDEAPKPGFDSVGEGASPAAKAVSGATRSAAPPSGATPAAASVPSGPAVQVGAYSSRTSAEQAWSRIAASQEALSGVKYRIVEGRADIGTVYRLQAMPGDGAAARALCAKLRAGGQDCTIKD